MRIMFLSIAILIGLWMTHPVRAQGEIVDEIAFQQHILDKPLTAQLRGMTFTMMYSADGTVAVRSNRMNRDGEWYFADGQLCISGVRGNQPRCGYLERLSANQFRTSQGMTMSLQ
ncbi:hypothetical protein [Thalassococcus sp. S3]|uniref:hypothetical protein n=1 Tax=Thalassococcus sp. S3 TaxID=2017482 RepID=UPI001023F782|nr:hypothetical protein [Thalassococcus sp. S3]QBF30692.1 hypothetical protein CFI11_05605 [Thalassococcus sp. S3]